MGIPSLSVGVHSGGEEANAPSTPINRLFGLFDLAGFPNHAA